LGVASIQTIRDERRDFGRPQIITLDILDHLRVSIRLATVVNDSWYFMQTSSLRGAVPSRTQNNNVSAVFTGTTKQNGLQHAVLANRLGKLIQLLFAEVAAWLIGVFVNAVDRDQARPSGSCVSLCRDIGQVLKAEIERHLPFS
jgi:hypothetical protein